MNDRHLLRDLLLLALAGVAVLILLHFAFR